MATSDFLTLATLAAGDPRRDAVPRAATSTGSWRASASSSARSCRPVERADLPRLRASTRPPSRAGRATRSSVLVMALVAIVAGYVVLPAPGRPAAQPGRHPGRCRRTSPSTRRSASRPTRTGRTTPARPGATLPDPGGGPRRPQLHLGRDRPGRRDRPVPRPDPAQRADARQLLGRPDPRHPVHPAADRPSSAPSSSSGRACPRRGTRPSTVTTLQGAQQTIALGPIASQEWIKELGNNGGGFFNANSAHPFENPTALTNWLEMFAILLIPFALTYTFGRYAGNQRQGWTIFGAMAVVLAGRRGRRDARRVQRQPALPGRRRPGRSGNMEGKEVRFGAAVGGLFAAVTTGTSTGAINAWHDSFQPIAGLVPLFNIELGEITPGRDRRRHVRDARHRRDPRRLHRRPDGRPDAGVPRQEGRGLRDQDGDARRPRPGRQHPRLHGDRERRCPEGPAGPLNAGPHGFSEILYAFSSQTGNNGSAFAGLTGNTPFYNVTGALAMLIGRYGMIVPILALAGSMAAKRRVAPSLGHLPDDRRRCSASC